MVVRPQEAGFELAIRGNTKTVAIGTELGVVKGAYYFDFSTIKTVLFPVMHTACENTAGAGGKHRLYTAKIAMVVTVVEMHQLDELEDKIPVAPDIVQEIIDLIVVNPGKDYHVEFDRGEIRPECGINPGKNISQAITAGDPLVGLRIQAVKADVDPAQTGLFEILCHICKQDAVGGNGGFNSRRHGPDDLENILADERFTPGEFDAPDPKLCCHIHDPDDLFRTHLDIRIFLSLCMAVDTGKVTPRGKADAEVGYRPVIGIPERFCCGHVRVFSAFEVLCDDINLCTSLTRGLGGIGFYRIEMLPYRNEQLGEINPLEGFDHEVPARL